MKYEIDIELENMPSELYVETINWFINEDMKVAINGNYIIVFNNMNGVPEKKISFDDAISFLTFYKSKFDSDKMDDAKRARFTAKCLKDAAQKLEDYAKSLDV